MKSRGAMNCCARLDSSKDQTYFLFGLKQEQMSRTDFPLGELDKTAVREIARRAALPVAEKPESQEICFVPSGNYVKFIAAYLGERGESLPEEEGDLVTTSGEVIGRHRGVHNYTVGQRKGLGIAAGRPLYVVELDRAANRVVVGDDCRFAHQRLRNARRELDFVRRPGSARARNSKNSPSPRAGGGNGRAHR